MRHSATPSRGAGSGAPPPTGLPHVGAETRAEKERRAADAHALPASAGRRRASVEQGVDLLHPRLDGDELGAALDDEAGVEAVALVHLERESAQVAEPVLAQLEKRLALALQLPRRGGTTYPGPAFV